MNRGVVLSPAVIPVALTVSWSKLTKPAVILGPILGAILGMAAWMIGCWKILGIYTEPANYDFKGTRAIVNLDGTDTSSSDDEKTEEGHGEVNAIDVVNREVIVLVDGNVVDIFVLKEGFKRAAWYSLALTLIVTIAGE
ncbi:hypothetical protein HHX47_DHR8000184 [Lentinula edodes]|nr:hypothetical protein HHX47_DHR8000184 [Lentinula edodes]